MYLKKDPGPCPVDDAPHTTCCAPNSGGAIIAGRVVTPTSITVATPTTAAPPSTPPTESTTFTTKNYRGRDKREPPTGG
jgi:hypothetical protein